MGARGRWAGCGVVAVLLGSDLLHRRWSRGLVGDPDGRSQAVVVLGFRNRGERANLVNRWRVRAALRSIDPHRTPVLVCSGGPVGSAVPEARLLAAYATELGYRGALVLEEESRTSWENVENVIGLIEDAEVITFVSQPAHALKVRDYLRRQRPDLADRLGGAQDHRWGEWMLAKPLLAVYGVISLRRAGIGVLSARPRD